MTTYQPQQGNLPERVCRHFLNNPSDELEPYYIALKFNGTNKYAVKTQLALAVSAGLLVLARNNDGDAVYGAGPQIESLRVQDTAGASAPAALGKHIPAKRGQGRAPKDEDYSTDYQVVVPVNANIQATVSETTVNVSEAPATVSEPELGIDQFVIEDGIPLPPAISAGKRTAQITALLAILKPGQPTAMSMRYHSVLSKVKAKVHKQQLGQYALRADRKTDMLRVWRVS